MNNTTATKVSKTEDKSNEKHNQVEAEHGEVESEHLVELDIEVAIFDNAIDGSVEEFLKSPKFVDYCKKVAAHFQIKYGNRSEKYTFPEDIVSDVFLKIYPAWLEKYRGKASIKTVIYRIIKNLFADAYREATAKKRQLHLKVDFDEGNLDSLQAENSFSEQLERDEANAELVRFLNSLEENDKVKLSIYAECNYKKAKTARLLYERGIEKEDSVYKLNEWLKSIKHKLNSWRRKLKNDIN